MNTMLKADKPNTPGNNILVVDDNLANLHLLVNILTEENYRVRPATSGASALKATLIEPPDLILLDILMPQMDGYEVCRILKEDPQTANIPIIFISALDETLDKVKAFTAGAVDYITIPFQFAEVLVRVQTHLTIRQLQDSLLRQNAELQEKNRQLQQALDQLETLSGLLPICANCKNIRDDDGYWYQVETYIKSHADVEFSHSICPDCAAILYPDFEIKT